MDWALIESWKEMEVPLHVALRGIENAFDSWESKPRKRTVKSLLYCQEEVEAQYAEWRESQVGAAAEPAASENGERQPFSRSAIVDHLQRGHAGLLSARAQRVMTVSDEFSEVLSRAAARIGELEEEFLTTSVEARKLELSLTGLERMLSEALLGAVGPEKLNALQQEVKDQLQPYRKQMDQSVYQQTFDNLLLKRLREQFGIPRLSLFYL